MLEVVISRSCGFETFIYIKIIFVIIFQEGYVPYSSDLIFQ